MEAFVPTPPPELFIREHRLPTTGEKVRTFQLERIECTPGKGNLVYHVGATYPKKGWPTPESSYALNQIKRILLETLKVVKNPLIAIGLLLTDKNKLMSSFNIVFDKIYETYILKEDYLCPTARGVYLFLTDFLMHCGYDRETSKAFSFKVAHFFEEDDAYRYLLQDLATAYEPKTALHTELNRLEKVYIKREERMGVAPKIRLVIGVIRFILYFPKCKKAFIHASPHIELMKYDEADWYWVCMRGEYNYGGKSWEDRQIGLVRPQAYYGTA